MTFLIQKFVFQNMTKINKSHNYVFSSHAHLFIVMGSSFGLGVVLFVLQIIYR